MARITGTLLDDDLVGTSDRDRILGLAGNDTLNGAANRDQLIGGAGNDTYLIDATDRLTERAGEGVDTVIAGFSYALLTNFESLILSGTDDVNGTGNAADNVIIGNAGSNVLSGGDGNDTLDGGFANFDVFGVDTLFGGAGDDVLIFDSDDVNAASGPALDGGPGTDTLRLAEAGQGINFLSTSFDAIKGIEVIDLAGEGNALLLSASVVQFLNSTGVLQIDGDADDFVGTVSDHFWTFGGYVTIGEQTYAEYLKAGVTVRVDLNIDAQFPDAFIQPVSVIELADLDGTDGFRMLAVPTITRFFDPMLGAAAAGAGDVNGDGFVDVIIGAPQAASDPNDIGGDFAGASYVIFGSASGFPAAWSVGDLDGANGFRLQGAHPNDFSGSSVAYAGDFNGDGFADMIIGAPNASPDGRTNAGESYVVYGGAGIAANVELGALDGTAGLRIIGAEAFEGSGTSVAPAGDVNGDGVPELIIGTFFGASYVVFGRAAGFGASLDLATLDGTDGFRFDGPGKPVASVADINGDGFDDVIIGNSDANAAVGESYVLFGKASGFAASLGPASLDGTNGFRLTGIDAGDFSGSSVASAGDLNGDGFGDVVIGAFLADPKGEDGAGESYVVFGKASGFAPSLDLATLDGTNGFMIEGIDREDWSGYSVAAAGDVNADGFDDLIIGAATADPHRFDPSGESYVVYGHSSFGASLDLAGPLDGGNGFRIEGSGAAVSGAGDVNGDGFADLAIGTHVVFGGNFSHEATHLGGSEANTLSGSASPDVMVSGEGNDTLSGGGGADAFRAGAGDDLVRIPDMSFLDIDAGSGTDALGLTGGGLTLDLTALADTKVSGIETIDLTGTGDNALTLAAGDLLDLSDTTNRLTVNGDSGDAVSLTGTWDDGGIALGYHTYTQGVATLLVDADVGVIFA